MVEKWNTSTLPLLIETDAGLAVLKYPSNPEGPHVIAADYIGTRLAAVLGLPTFDISILTLAGNEDLTNSRGEELPAGACMAVRYEEGDKYVGESILPLVENLDDIPRIVVLDYWLRNCDRHFEGRKPNYGNLFLSIENASEGHFILKPIDHGSCFTCEKPLTPALNHIDNVRDTREYGLFPRFRETLLARRPIALSCCDRLRNLRREELATVIHGIPPDWNVDLSARNGMIEFALDRAHFLADNFCGWFWHLPGTTETVP